MDKKEEVSNVSLIRNKLFQSGQGLVEYALILTLVAIVVIGILAVVGPGVGNVFCNVSNSMTGTPAAPCTNNSNNPPNCSGNNGNGNGNGNCNGNGNGNNGP